MANKLKFKLGDGFAPTGSGFIDWKRLEKRLRDINELQDEDILHTVEIDSRGITYTTKKKTKT